jgi:uncharacterized protein YciI
MTTTFSVATTVMAVFSPQNSRMMAARFLKKAVVGAAAVSRRTVSSRTTSLAAIQYLLKYDYIPDVLEKRGPFRERHLELAKQLIAEGKCLSGGPTTPTTTVGDKEQQATATVAPTGALFIFTDKNAAKQFVDQDPYVSNGIVSGHVIEEWNIVVQKE